MEEFENKQDFSENETQETNENKVNQAGWTYSANTNQYATMDGSNDSGNSNYQTQQNSARPEYGTQYGYYSNSQSGYSQKYSQQDPNYYSQKYGQWDFNRYEAQEKNKKSSGKGFKVFLIIVGILLGCCLITLAGVKLLKNFVKLPDLPDFPSWSMEDKNNDKQTEDTPKKDESQSPEKNNNKNENAPELILDSKPNKGNNIILSASEVYKHVNPSIVGVIQYQYSRSMDPMGSGSGIIISEDGYIITNAHVISEAEAVKVVLYNEEEYEAQVIGSDVQTDVAVLKITAKNLSAANLGDSSLVEVGESAYVLGNPGGLIFQSSFSHGIISGLNRTITTSDSIYSMTVIQTDAAINPGNSGGALINEYGQVIGITSSKLKAIDYEGVGFAIPTAIAIPIAQELIEKGYISGRAILGITARPIDVTTSRYYGVPQGIQIVSFSDDSSFNDSKVQIGDIIVKFEGTEVSSMKDLQQILSQYHPGDVVELEIYRYATQRANDSTFTVKVTLSENKG